MPRIEPEELGRLYREHAPALRLYARQWPAGDEDQVQDAFIKLAQQATAPVNPLPWLYQVVRNAARQAARGWLRRRCRENLASGKEVWFTAADDVLDGRHATRLLGELPLDQRETVVARIWGGLTFDDISRLVGCPVPTAHRRYHAGLTALREKMEQQWTVIPQTKTT